MIHQQRRGVLKLAGMSVYDSLQKNKLFCDKVNHSWERAYTSAYIPFQFHRETFVKIKSSL